MTAYANNLLGALSRALTDRVAAALDTTLGIGGNAAPALLSVGTRPGESIDQLSRVLRLTHSATVRMVDRLEQRGWVQRDRGGGGGGGDGRTAALTLTATGRSAFRRLLKARNTAVNRVTGVLGDRENETLRKLLTKMLASLPGDRAEARHICRMCEHGVCVGPRCPVGSAV